MEENLNQEQVNKEEVFNQEETKTKPEQETVKGNSIELTKKEVDELVLRQQLVIGKKNDANRLMMESFLLEQGMKLYYNDLIEKYQLDKTKSFKFDAQSGTLTEEVHK